MCSYSEQSLTFERRKWNRHSRPQGRLALLATGDWARGPLVTGGSEGQAGSGDENDGIVRLDRGN